MARIPLVGGSYSTRSVVASAQRCLNLFPEKNPDGSAPAPYTYYQRPGLTVLASGPAAPVRGVHRASNGLGFVVIGQNVYALSATWQLTQIGQLAVPSTRLTSMTDNGTNALLVDGSNVGYQFDINGPPEFQQVVDSTGTFAGATKVDFIDTFILWAPVSQAPGTAGYLQFGSTLSGSPITFNSLYTAGKTDYPDPLVTLLVNRHEIYLFGQLKTEQWYDAGNTTFPFAELPGAYIEHGCVSPYTVASSDISVFWLGLDLQGQGVVFMNVGYECKRISNHALEYAIRKIANSVGISDAIAYTYQQDGHVFYVLTFPAGDQTWVYDAAVGDPAYAWHQRSWADANGTPHRERANCHGFLYGKNVVGDWQNGTLYALDLDNYTDAGEPIQFSRTFPIVTTARPFDSQENATPFNFAADGRRIKFHWVSADVQAGDVPLDASGNPASIWLRWSDDRGRKWSQALVQTLGQPGVYNAQPLWRTLGIGRWRVYELGYSAAGPAALGGLWYDAEVLES